MVDGLDLDAFATTYLEQDSKSVDWCAFYGSANVNQKYFRQVTSDNFARYRDLMTYIAAAYDCKTVTESEGKSDLNGDGVVDLDDLAIFSMNYLEQSWESVDWCVFHGAVLSGSDFEGRSTKYYLRHFGALLDFINDYFSCGAPEPPPSNLVLENTPQRPYRLALAGGYAGGYYFTDPGVGSMFVCDVLLAPTAEIKGLNKPLAVAVDSLGRILIGNDGRDNIEVYDPATGDLIAEFGTGTVRTPNAITFDAAGNIYVTDSRAHHVKVFDSSFNFVRTIGNAGEGQKDLLYPIDTEIMAGAGGMPEIFIADQGNNRIQVFDFDGNWLRSFTYAGKCGMLGCTSPGFSRLQALDSDAYGRLHVLDSFAAGVNIFDPADGTHLGNYGSYGETAGYLQVPRDVLVTGMNSAMIIAGDGDRIEVFTTP
jgi:hypothetical protein